MLNLQGVAVSLSQDSDFTLSHLQVELQLPLDDRKIGVGHFNPWISTSKIKLCHQKAFFD
jgi:hypothetical protein